MYYIAKLAQAAGLTIIGFDFIRTFPEYPSRKIFILGIILFIFGWVIDKYMLKR